MTVFHVANGGSQTQEVYQLNSQAQSQIVEPITQASVFVHGGGSSHLVSESFLGNGGGEIPTKVTNLDVLDDFGHVGSSSPFGTAAFQGFRFKIVHESCNPLDLVLCLENLLVHVTILEGRLASSPQRVLRLTVASGGEDSVDLARGTLVESTELGGCVGGIGHGVVQCGKALAENIIFATEVVIFSTSLCTLKVSILRSKEYTRLTPVL